MKKLLVLLITAASLASGCTSVEVRPVPSGLDLSKMCIIENSRVKVSDMLPVLSNGLTRHNITPKVYAASVDECEYNLTYIASETWDMAPYMHYAQVIIRSKDGKMVGLGEYNLKSKGGLSLYKFNKTKTKLDPILDELLKNY